MRPRRELLTVQGCDLLLGGKKVGVVDEIRVMPEVYVPTAKGCIILELHFDDPDAYRQVANGDVPTLSISAGVAQPRDQVGWRTRR